jgi:hypothetical protein
MWLASCPIPPRSSNRARARRRPRYRALTVAGLKRVALGESARTKLAKVLLLATWAIDNEHDREGSPCMSLRAADHAKPIRSDAAIEHQTWLHLSRGRNDTGP